MPVNVLWARIKRRAEYTVLVVAAAALLVIWEWLGLPTKRNPAPMPRPLTDLWWHFPAYAAVIFVLMLLVPRSVFGD